MLLFNWVKRWVKCLFPNAEKLANRLMLTRYNLWDCYYAYSPFTQNKTSLTRYGFLLTGGNSVHHRSMRNGTFEPNEVALIGKYVNEIDVFVDVGANIGFFACLARKAGKQTIAIEPQVKNLDYLYRNVIANSWNDVEVYPVGLSHKPGVAFLYGVSSTGASLIPGWAGGPKSIKRIIPISTLDILLGKRFAKKRLFIKVDVEGVEFDVIRGSIETLRMHPKPIWMIEITSGEFYPGGVNPHFSAIFRVFSRNGYQAKSVAKGGRVVTQTDIDLVSKTGDSGALGYNFIFS